MRNRAESSVKDRSLRLKRVCIALAVQLQFQASASLQVHDDTLPHMCRNLTCNLTVCVLGAELDIGQPIPEIVLRCIAKP